MYMITTQRTTSDNPDFQNLVAALDKLLAVLDGDEHAFYAQFNKTANLDTDVVYYDNDIALGCGAFRQYDLNTIEIKRMYTAPEARRKGIAALILRDLEQWALELSYTTSLLETGNKQPEAISLYQKLGYRNIPNFGPYESVINSICIKKNLQELKI